MTFTSRLRVSLTTFTLASAGALLHGTAHGQATPAQTQSYGEWTARPRAPAFEANLLWPFFPGGMTDFRVQLPVLRVDQATLRGELVVGAFSDFGWRSIREPNAGRVAMFGAKIGWRQFFAYGLHVEALLHAGWRHEENNPWDGLPIDSLQGRVWFWAGYQHEFNRTVYANARGGLGIHAFRTDRFADRERLLAPGVDLNLGFRFW